MIDEIELFAELRPVEPRFSSDERARVRAAAFGRAGPSLSEVDVGPVAEPTVVGRVEFDSPEAGPHARRRGAGRQVPAVAAAVVALLGLGGIWALSASRGSTGPSTRATTPAPATSTSSPSVDQTGSARFVYQVSSYSGTEAIVPTSIDESGVCFAVTQEHQSATPCADAETISTGLAWGLFGEPGGSLLVGVVPDAVDVVEVDGRAVEIVGNVWSTHVQQTPVELRVGDSSTGQFATVTISDQPTAQTTTTTTN